jgi:two-component system CheB/CheR fusion protein
MTAEELESMLMNSVVGFSILRGRDLVFELANGPYLELAGRTRAEVIGRRYRDIFPELAGTGTFEMLERVLDTGEPFGMKEYRLVLVRDGAPRECFFDFTVQPTRDETGTITGLMGIAIDVTELVVRRRDAEALAERLRASEERFRGAQETSLDAFMALRCLKDPAGEIIDFEFLFQNEAAARINGLDPANILGRRLLESFPGLLQNEIWGHILQLARTGQPFRTEVRYQQNGFDTWLRVLGSKVGDGVAISFSDITERKRMEASAHEAREKAEFLAADIAQQCREMEATLLQMRAERDQAWARVAELERSRTA